MSALFRKTKKEKSEKETKKTENKETVVENSEKPTFTGSMEFLSSGGANAHKILKGFYVSEKATFAGDMNQYFFKVFNRANKSEIKKEVGKLFDVKVKAVKILNMPKKRRDLGKHPGFKAEYKKAIVVLEDGYTIGQAQ